MINRYNTRYLVMPPGHVSPIYTDFHPGGEFMRADDVLEFLRQLEDTLPDYTDGTYDNDQICDVSWEKTRLQEELG